MSLVLRNPLLAGLGLPEKAEAVSGPGELRPTAEAYAMTWKFAPVKRDGKAVKARFKVVMPFKLR